MHVVVICNNLLCLVLFRISSFFKEIQLVSYLGFSYQMLHGTGCEILRDICFIFKKLNSFRCGSELKIKVSRDIRARVYFNWQTIL